MDDTRVNELDLLRFCAAMSVVLFHYAFMGYYAQGDVSVMAYSPLAGLFKYGYLGVHFFFMISGFVILMTASRASLRAFAISRIVRLYPAFWACCTMTFVAIVFMGGSHFSASLHQYLVNMTMLGEFFGARPIDGAYWSLFVEIKFYALVAVVLIMRRIDQAQIFLILWLIVSIALELRPIGKLRYLLVVDYSALFIAGAECYLIRSQGLSPTKLAIIVLSWCLAVDQALKQRHALEAFFRAELSTNAVAGIISIFYLVMLSVALRSTGLLAKKSWRLTGALTYPLYLLHQNIGYMIFNLEHSSLDPHLLFWGTVALVFGAAVAVHFLIEKRTAPPLRRALERVAYRLPSLCRPVDSGRTFSEQ